MTASAESTGDVRARIATVPMWYHTIEVAPGVLTPGMFDLRPTVDRLPWPDVRGKRCLDVGTSDGFLAFELERRGAAEVVAADIPAHEEWDIDVRSRGDAVTFLRHVSGPAPGVGFRVAHELLGSSVVRQEINVYDLSPDAVGEFDVVVSGSLLLHLRDPLRALAAIRSVCRGELLCSNQIELLYTVLHRSRPVARLDGTSGLAQWWLPNAAGHRQMLLAAGFDVLGVVGPYPVHFGPGHPPRRTRSRERLRALARRCLIGADGVPHYAALARPAINSGRERSR